MKALVTFAAATLLSTAALAQNETASPPQPATTPPPAASPQSGSIFDALDADHSGGIAQQEAQAHPTVSQNFATGRVHKWLRMYSSIAELSSRRCSVTRYLCQL